MLCSWCARGVLMVYSWHTHGVLVVVYGGVFVVCCSDINECENEDLCMYGRCVNKPGGYECLCDDEHQLIPTGTGCVGLYSLYSTSLSPLSLRPTQPLIPPG